MRRIQRLHARAGSVQNDGAWAFEKTAMRMRGSCLLKGLRARPGLPWGRTERLCKRCRLRCHGPATGKRANERKGEKGRCMGQLLQGQGKGLQLAWRQQSARVQPDAAARCCSPARLRPFWPRPASEPLAAFGQANPSSAGISARVGSAPMRDTACSIGASTCAWRAVGLGRFKAQGGKISWHAHHGQLLRATLPPCAAWRGFDKKLYKKTATAFLDSFCKRQGDARH